MTGMFSRAAASQIGDSSGSLIASLVPSAFCRVHAGLFEDFQTDGAVLHVGFELRRGLPAVARRDAAELIQPICEHREAVRVRRAVDVAHALRERVAGSAAQVVEHADVQRVHLGDERRDGAGRGTRVAVDIDDREFRSRHRMLIGDERRGRPVIDDRGRRETPAPGMRRRERASCPVGIRLLPGRRRARRGLVAP